MCKTQSGTWMLLLLWACNANAGPPAPTAQRSAIGRIPTKAEILKADLTVLPNGSGLPSGAGTPREGKQAYAALCAACHGAQGEGAPGYAALVGGRGTLAGPYPVLTVGSYWPQATTLWDYIRRAMPYQSPGSLTNDQVYAITAWILFANGIIPEDTRLDRRTLPRVEMPNRGGFVPDSRPDVGRRTRPIANEQGQPP